MPIALFALTAGAFGIGTTEFIIMGLLLQVAADLHVSLPAAGLLISGYALGVCVGAPVLTLATRRMPRKLVLVGLMAIFTVGNIACALAPTYGTLMAARVLTSLAHGTFFGVGSIVATGLVPENRRASAIATMFTGLTVATLLGVPFGAWFGLTLGWRAAFWAVAAIGIFALVILVIFVPAHADREDTHVALRDELAVLARPQVQLGLAMTVLGFAGLFTVFTYIQPILTELAGFTVGQVSAVLLVFGAGLSAGNIVGGRLADRMPGKAIIGTLAVLTLVLLAMTFAVHARVTAVSFVGMLGAAAFATVSPMQLRILDKAGESGRTLASSLNIAAFNLGNALGAWAGGLVITRHLGLGTLPLLAAAITGAGLLLAILSLRMDGRARQPAS